MPAAISRHRKGDLRVPVEERRVDPIAGIPARRDAHMIVPSLGFGKAGAVAHCLAERGTESRIAAFRYMDLCRDEVRDTSETS